MTSAGIFPLDNSSLNNKLTFWAQSYPISIFDPLTDIDSKSAIFSSFLFSFNKLIVILGKSYNFEKIFAIFTDDVANNIIILCML